MDYLDKAIAMINSGAFHNLVEGKITWDEYVEIRNQPERKPFVPSLVVDNTIQ